MLGAQQFEVHLGASIEGLIVNLPETVTLTGRGVDWLRYQTDHPIHANPMVIQYLVNIALPVVGLSEVPRSLEKVYLQAINGGADVEPVVETIDQLSSNGETIHAG